MRLTRLPATLIAMVLAGAALALFAIAPAAQARESLGVYATWGAFRDPLIPRCYAIAMADPSAAARSYQPFVAVGSWPRRGSRGQVHFRLSRKVAPNTAITLSIGGKRIVLAGGGGDAWAATDTDNAAIVAAMRVAPAMTVNARDIQGRNFANRYPLAGAASAMDAALLGCARVR